MHVFRRKRASYLDEGSRETSQAALEANVIGADLLEDTLSVLGLRGI